MGYAHMYVHVRMCSIGTEQDEREREKERKGGREEPRYPIRTKD